MGTVITRRSGAPRIRHVHHIRQNADGTWDLRNTVTPLSTDMVVWWGIDGVAPQAGNGYMLDDDYYVDPTAA